MQTHWVQHSYHFFHLCCWTYRLKSYKGRKICQFKLVHFSKSVPVHTVSAPSCSMYFHLFGPLESCVSVLFSGVVHIQYPVFLWTLLIGCLNISPQFMSIKFRVRAGCVWTAKHSCKSNESTWTTRERKENSSIRRTGREGRRLWWGTWPSFFFHHMAAPPVMSEVRGIFFFNCSKHCTCLKSSVQKHGSNALSDCLAVCVNYMHYASLL